MALVDFLLLTEMKSGISSFAGVEELVSLIQQQKDCVSNNGADVFKQWSAVLCIISATENKEYLDHFVQLDGLTYLHMWLMEAQKCSDYAVEELVNALLTTIERLPANLEKFISCGIMITVEQLRGHKSITIKNKANVLLDRWCNTVAVGVEENFQPIRSVDSKVIGKDLSFVHPLDISPFKESGERLAGEESIGTESHHSNLTRCSDSSQVENHIKFMASNQTVTATSSNSTCVDGVGDCNSSVSSLALSSCQEKYSAVSFVCPAVELAHARTSSFHTASQEDDNMQEPAVGDVKVGPDEIEMEINRREGYICTSLQKETFDVSSSSTLSASMLLEEGLEHVPLNLVYGKGELSSLKNVECPENSIQCGMTECLRTTKESGRAGASHEITVDINLKPSMQTEPSTPVDCNLSASKSTRIAQKSVFGLDEEMDALEVAWQVAVEVEREVVGYREPFSSSPDVLCGDVTDSQSPDSANGIQDTPDLDVGKFSPSEHASNFFSSQKINLQLSGSIVDDPMTHEQVSESPRMMPAAKEKELVIEKIQCGFDLNVDIYKGEIECFANPIPTGTVKLSAPIVVFASKGVPGFPVSSFHFKGELGWKGSSTTSAFRPASPRRTPDSEKVLGLKQKLNFVEIDLNVTETQNDGIVEPASVRQVPISSGHPSRESSVEVSSRKAAGLRLDLNRLGDEDVAAIPSLNWRLQLHDGDRSSSSASSSCSKQPYMRDFDLNDNPTLVDSDASCYLDKTASKTFRTCGSSKRDDSVINIMGLRMPLDRKLCMSQARQEPFLNNGMVMENILPAKPMMHYPQISAAYGYNFLQPGASTPMPPTVLYGPGSISYMVDSRGTMIPQVMELAGISSIPSASRQPPFLMNVTGAPLGLRGSRSTVVSGNINSGIATCETGRRNGEANFNHLFMQNGISEEKLTSLQPFSSGIVLKRKEPGSRQEGHHPLGFKQKSSWK